MATLLNLLSLTIRQSVYRTAMSDVCWEMGARCVAARVSISIEIRAFLIA